MEGVELICFQIISSVGAARSTILRQSRRQKPEILKRLQF